VRAVFRSTTYGGTPPRATAGIDVRAGASEFTRDALLIGLPLILLFALTALTSALLLFWVEPLFARMVLPLLGGSPAVWNTCLMFFQAALLGGYLYAHLTTRLLGVRRQGLLHMALLALTLFALPVAIPAGWTPPASDRVVGWLLALLAVGVGAPFLMLSATAPLLQRWLAGMEHPSAVDPYILYAASNAGSLLGLLAFPIILEPRLRLGQQSSLWGMGYLVAGGLTALCAGYVWRHAREYPVRAAADGLDGLGPLDTGDPTLGGRLRWVALAFVPSSLLLGVTTYLTTDVAAVPFLWVAPLALYLLTFVIVFARPGRVAPRLPVELHAVMVTVFVLVTFWHLDLGPRWAYPLHLGLFTITALALHGELAASRPSPRHLTEFYLWLALGGALGGAFNALAAPVLFDSVREYVPMVVLACFLRPSQPLRVTGMMERLQTVATVALPSLLLAVVIILGLGYRDALGVSGALIASVIAAAIALAQRRSAPLFGTSLAAVALAGLVLFRPPQSLLDSERSFFGAYSVARDRGATWLYHGTTIHGAQSADSARRMMPIIYYHPAGPVGQFFESLGARLEGKRIGVVGLGAGTLLCYASRGQQWTFFELDPLVERIARNPAYFTFLRDCPVQPRVVLGDARLTLAREPPGKYALLVLDAFSSDAIPVHLLTREALALYERLLEPGGVLLVHISNQNLRLEPVVAALADDAGLIGIINEYDPGPLREVRDLDYGCDWVVLANRNAGVGGLLSASSWRDLKDPGQKPWTDDYSNVFRVIRW
jgi:hypothetical protein